MVNSIICPSLLLLSCSRVLELSCMAVVVCVLCWFCACFFFVPITKFYCRSKHRIESTTVYSSWCWLLHFVALLASWLAGWLVFICVFKSFWDYGNDDIDNIQYKTKSKCFRAAFSKWQHFIFIPILVAVSTLGHIAQFILHQPLSFSLCVHSNYSSLVPPSS